MADLRKPVNNLTLSRNCTFADVAKVWLNGARHALKPPSLQRREICINGLSPQRRAQLIRRNSSTSRSRITPSALSRHLPGLGHKFDETARMDREYYLYAICAGWNFKSIRMLSFRPRMGFLKDQRPSLIVGYLCQGQTLEFLHLCLNRKINFSALGQGRKRFWHLSPNTANCQNSHSVSGRVTVEHRPLIRAWHRNLCGCPKLLRKKIIGP